MLEWSGSICVIRFHHNPPVTNLHGGMFVIKLLSHRIYFSNLPRTERVIWLCWGILFWRSATNQPTSSCPHITRKWYSHFLSFHKRSHTREEVARPVSHDHGRCSGQLHNLLIMQCCIFISDNAFAESKYLFGPPHLFGTVHFHPPPVVVMLL